MESLQDEINQLEKELINHEGYLKRGYLSDEGYKKWYKKKRSLVCKIRRRKQKLGFYLDESEFQKLYEKCETSDRGTTFDIINKYNSKLTVNQRNKLTHLVISQHCEHYV